MGRMGSCSAWADHGPVEQQRPLAQWAAFSACASRCSLCCHQLGIASTIAGVGKCADHSPLTRDPNSSPVMRSHPTYASRIVRFMVLFLPCVSQETRLPSGLFASSTAVHSLREKRSHTQAASYITANAASCASHVIASLNSCGQPDHPADSNLRHLVLILCCDSGLASSLTYSLSSTSA